MPYRPKPYSRTLTNYRRGSRINYRIGARLANRVGRSFTRTMRKRKTSGRGVTFQRDEEVIYRKRRMPKRRRRMWKRFVQKSVAANEKAIGSRTIVRNSSVNFTQLGLIGNTTNALGQLALYPVNNGSHDYLQDLRIITTDTDVPPSGKFIFQSGVFDMTVTNTSTTDQNLPGFDVPIELDIYEISGRRNFEKADGDKGLLDVFTEGFSDTSLISTIGNDSSLSITRRGVTPFDCPQALSMYKLKIWKKTKYRMSAGNAITYQMRDPTRHVMERGYVTELSGSNLPGVTKWLLLVAKPIAGYSLTETGILRISCGVTRKYFYKLKEKNEDKDAFVAPAP